MLKALFAFLFLVPPLVIAAAPAEVRTGASSYSLSTSERVDLAAKAVNGDNAAARRLARHHDFVAGDPATGLRFLTLAAARNDPEAQYELGLRLIAMRGVDKEEGILWLERAAGSGHRQAMSELERLRTKDR